MITIRAATAVDRGAIIDLGLRFATSVPAFAAVVEGASSETLGLFLDVLADMGDKATILLAVADAGRIVGCLPICEAPRLFVLTGGNIAEELAWWVEPEHRGRAGLLLLTAAIDWARAKNLKMLKMGAPAGTQVGTLYERKGFLAVETAYLKVL